MLITNGGVLVRTRVSEVSQIGRATQGVRLINLGKGEKLVSIERVDPLEAADGDTEITEAPIEE